MEAAAADPSIRVAEQQQAAPLLRSGSDTGFNVENVLRVEQKYNVGVKVTLLGWVVGL